MTERLMMPSAAAVRLLMAMAVLLGTAALPVVLKIVGPGGGF
jgi:hypothetical protein